MILLPGAMLALPVAAIEVAPRISGREIIGSLAEIKIGQKALEDRMDMRLSRVDQRFEFLQQLMQAINDLELKAPDGSRLIRMMHALKELAKENKKLETVLRDFSLL